MYDCAKCSMSQRVMNRVVNCCDQTGLAWVPSSWLKNSWRRPLNACGLAGSLRHVARNLNNQGNATIMHENAAGVLSLDSTSSCCIMKQGHLVRSNVLEG